MVKKEHKWLCSKCLKEMFLMLLPWASDDSGRWKLNANNVPLKQYHVLVKAPFRIMIIFGIWQRLANIKHRYGLFLVWKVQDLPCDTPTCDGWSLRSCPLCLWTSNPRGAPRPQSLQTQFSEQTFLYALASLYFFRHGPRSWRVSYKLSDRPARAEPHSARNSPDRRMWEGTYQLLRSTDAPEQMRL